VGERTREGNDLWLEMSEGGVIVPGNSEKSRAALIYGQMTDARIASPRGLTASRSRNISRPGALDVLLFIDNIFRFVQAGSEVSALLGRMPSAVGYQPNLNTEIGELQERITSTKSGSITSVQAIYVPADDYTDPAPAATFAHLDATTNLSRQIVERASIRRSIRWRVLHAFSIRASLGGALRRGARREINSAALQGPPGHYRHSRYRRTFRRRQAHRGARAQDRKVPLAAHVRRRAVHRLEGKYVKIEDTFAASRKSWKASTTTFRTGVLHVARSTKRLQGEKMKASA